MGGVHVFVQDNVLFTAVRDAYRDLRVPEDRAVHMDGVRQAALDQLYQVRFVLRILFRVVNRERLEVRVEGPDFQRNLARDHMRGGLRYGLGLHGLNP